MQQALNDDNPPPQNESSNGQLTLKEQTHTPPAPVFLALRRSTPPPPPGGAEMCSDDRSGSHRDSISQKGPADQTNERDLVSNANEILAISKDHDAEIKAEMKTTENSLRCDKTDKKKHNKSVAEMDGCIGENITGTLKESSGTDCTNLSQSSLYTFETVVAPLYHEIFTRMDTRRKTEMELKDCSKHEKVDELNSLASTQRGPQIMRTMPNISEHKTLDNLLPSNDKKEHFSLTKNAICQRADTKQEELVLEKTSVLCLLQKTKGTSSNQQKHSLSENLNFQGVQEHPNLCLCHQDIVELQANSILGHQSYTAETNTDKEHIQPHMTISCHSETPIDKTDYEAKTRLEVQSQVSEHQVSGLIDLADRFALDPHRSPRNTQGSAGCPEGTESADVVEEDPGLLLSQSDNFTALGGINSALLDAAHIQSQTPEDADDIQTQTGENTLNSFHLEPMSPDSRDKTVTTQNNDFIKVQISDLIPTQMLEKVPVGVSKEPQWMTLGTAEKTLNLHVEKCETAEDNEKRQQCLFGNTEVGMTYGFPATSTESSCPHNVSEDITVDSFTTSVTFTEYKHIQCQVNRDELHGNGKEETETLDNAHRHDSVATEENVLVIPDECRHDYGNLKSEQLERTFKEICYSPDNILLPTNLPESPVPFEIQGQENPTLTQTSNRHKTISIQSPGTTNTQLVFTTDKTQVAQADNDFTISESDKIISKADIRCVQTQGIEDATDHPHEDKDNSRSLNQTTEDTISERHGASTQPITGADAFISEDSKATLCNHLILNPILHSTQISCRNAVPSDEERPEQTISIPLHPEQGITSIRPEQQSSVTTQCKEMEGEVDLIELPRKNDEVSGTLKDSYECASSVTEETELSITDLGQQCFEGENPNDCSGMKLEQLGSNLKEATLLPNERANEETEQAISDLGQLCFEGENPNDCGGMELEHLVSNIKEVALSSNNSLLAAKHQQNSVATEHQSQDDKALTQTSKKDKITSLQTPGTTNTPVLHISDTENSMDKSQVLQAPGLLITTNFKAERGENCRAFTQTKKDPFSECAEADTSPDVSIPEDAQNTSCNDLVLAQTLHPTHTSHKNTILTDDENTVLKSTDAEHSKYLQITGTQQFGTEVEHRPDESTSSYYAKEIMATKPEQHEIVLISTDGKDTQGKVYVAEKNNEETKIPNDKHKSDKGVHKKTEPGIHDWSGHCFQGQNPKEFPYLTKNSSLAANFPQISVANETQGQENPTLTQASNKDVLTSFHTPGTTNTQQLQNSLKENIMDKNQVLQTDNDLTFPESSLLPTTYCKAESEENSRPLLQTKKDLFSERQEKMSEVVFQTNISDNKDPAHNHLTPFEALDTTHKPDKSETQTPDDNTSMASGNAEQCENLHIMEQYKTAPQYCSNHSEEEETPEPNLQGITNNQDVTTSTPEQHTSLVSTDCTNNPNEESKAEAKEGTHCTQTEPMNESFKEGNLKDRASEQQFTNVASEGQAAQTLDNEIKWSFPQLKDIRVPSTDSHDLTLALLQTSTALNQLTNVDMQEEREKESNKQETAKLTAVGEDVNDGEEQSETWRVMMESEYDADYTTASTGRIHLGGLENTGDEAEIGVDPLLALTGQEDMDVNRHLPMMNTQTLNKLEKHTVMNLEKAVQAVTKYCESTEKEHKAYPDNSRHVDYLYCSADSVWLAYDNYHILETPTDNLENILKTSTGNIENTCETSGNIENILETSTGNIQNILETSGNIKVHHEAGEKNVDAEGKGSDEAEESEQGEKQLGNEQSKEMPVKEHVSVAGACSQIKGSSELSAAVCELDYGETPEEQLSGIRESSLIVEDGGSESPDDSTGSVSDDEMELYMHALRAAQKSQLKDSTGPAKKEASLSVFKRASLSKSGRALPSITESVDEEDQITGQADEENASPQLIRNPARDPGHEEPDTGEVDWEQWKQTLSLDNVSRVLICVLMFVLFIVTAYYYDFMACFVLYIFTAYWLCCQKETAQIK